MSAEDIIRSRVFRESEPFPWEQICWQLAQLTALIDNRLPGPARQAKGASDFFMKWGPVVHRGATPVARSGGYRPAPREQDPLKVHRIMSGIFGAPGA